MSAGLTPQPTIWPDCPTCLAPFVLRRVTYLDGRKEWSWQRDCKHRGDPHIVGCAEPVTEAS